MTLKSSILNGASLANNEWQSIDGKASEKLVFRLQMRIAKAMREKKFNKVKALQRLLTRSHSAKALAVKKVTSNKGARTPGVDGKIWKTDKQKAEAIITLRHRGYKAMPVRRVYITKGNGKRRPLGIMTIADRAMQALSLFALEPVSETLADVNSYGFRPNRSCADAIAQVFNSLASHNKARWILEGDIESCFDGINHEWLENNILMEKTLLKKWLKAGYMDQTKFCLTEKGTPQGAIISPCLTLLTLTGLEKAAKAGLKRSDKVNVIVYADDFVITGNSKEILENHVKPNVEAFLKQRGLKLSKEKTRITHITQGFDFLGFNVRKYQETLLIKPAKKNIKNFLAEIRSTIKSNLTAKTESLIYLLNPKIRGWVNYYSNVVSKKAFSYVDNCIYTAIFNWCKRRHPNKGLRWIKKKYFRSQDSHNWIFFAKRSDKRHNSNIDLFEASRVKIKRHIKIKAKATPFDPGFIKYLIDRKMGIKCVR